MTVDFKTMGGIEARIDGIVIDLGHPRQRGVLGVLLVEANRPVTIGQLLDRVWGEQPPTRGRETLYNYLSRLRKVLSVIGEVRLDRRSGGYLLTVDELMVDLHQFRQLLTQAKTVHDDHQAVLLFEQALRLRRGELLPELDAPWAAGLRVAVEKEWLAAELDHADTALRCGRHTDLLPGLLARAGHYPLDERLAGQVMLGLYRSGRQAEALAHYQDIHARLADQLGTDPGPELRQLHQKILTAAPDLATPATTATPVPAPCQLPAAPRPFTGRSRELAKLTDSLDAAATADGRTVAIAALAGAGGIGKTWLVLHWAHANIDRFPDGQLFVDLRGFSPEGHPMPAGTALRGFLEALGVDPAQIPIDTHAQAARFRSLVAHKRMLVVLDNAADTDQVVPLLPGWPTVTVVITSRHQLTGLITRHSARHLPVDVFTETEARALLTAWLGADRMAAAPEAVRDLVSYCGGFPLALSIIASRAQTHPHLSLATLAADLRETGLRALTDDDPAASLPTMLSWSYRALVDEHAHVFRLLGIAPGPDIGLPAATALTGQSASETRSALEALYQASLLDHTAADRYRMHDLIRHYAANQAHDDQTQADRTAALQRVTDFYLHTAVAAQRLLAPRTVAIELSEPAAGVRPLSLRNPLAALGWLISEHTNLLAVQRLAVEQEWHTSVWQLAWALTTFHERQAHSAEHVAVWQAGLTATWYLADQVAQAQARRFLGRAYALLELHTDAIEQLHGALDLTNRTGDFLLRAYTHETLAWVYGQQGDKHRALAHATDALRLFGSLDDPAGEAHALNELGWCEAQLGDYTNARIHCETGLTMARRHGDLASEAVTLDSLGYVAHHTGDYQRAHDYYQQALTLYRGTGDTYDEADILDRLAHTHHALGNHDRAHIAWQQALQLYRKQGRRNDVHRMLGYHGTFTWSYPEGDLVPDALKPIREHTKGIVGT